MKKYRNNILLGAVLLLIGGAITYFILTAKNYANWQPTYNHKREMPYDLSLMKALFRERAKGKIKVEASKKITEGLPKFMEKYETQSDLLYVFLGENYFATPNDLDTLLQFIEVGNTALLCTNQLDSSAFRDAVFTDEVTDYDFSYSVETDSIEVALAPESMDKQAMRFVVEDSTTSYWWHFMSSEMAEHEGVEVLLWGRQYGETFRPLLLRRAYGKGEVYFSTLPLFFTNYYLKEESHFALFQEVLKNLPDGPVYWDATSQRFQFEFPSGGGRPQQPSPLSYILSQEPLAWAWYSGLVLLALFLFFGTKRKSKLIPVLQTPKNTSRIFGEAISALYFRRRDHDAIARMYRQSFLEHLRGQLYISLPLNHPDLLELLWRKTQYDKQELKNLLAALQKEEGLEAAELLALEDSVQTFFKAQRQPFKKA